MVDWLTYKGQNPWTCVALHDKVEYNEGSYIAKSPKVSGGTPTWEIGKTGPAITDTHVPCGYWFKDYDSDSQLRRICFGLEMGYTKTDMVVDEQQTLYVKDSNGDTVACPITVWTLSGVGSLSESVVPTTVYTAPSYSGAGADSATITLWCGGAVKDTLVISVAHSCDCLDIIMGYTKTDMVVDEQQTLYVKDSNGDTVACPITTWTLSGVGSISESLGPTTVYTAPSYSESGADSATITLWCGGAVKDTLVISIAHSCDCLDTTEYYFIHNFETAVDQPDYVWDKENPESFELYYFNYNHSTFCVLDPDAKFGNYACHVVDNTIVGMYYEPLSYESPNELTPPLTYEFWFKFIEGSEGSYMEIWLNGYKDLGYDWIEAMYQVIFGTWKGVETSFDNIGTWGGGYDYEEYTEYPVFYRPFSFNVYNHYAIVILPDRIKTFINGILFKEYISGGFNVPYSEFYIDSEDDSKLLIDALSITKGEKYTTNFTPPTEPPSK